MPKVLPYLVKALVDLRVALLDLKQFLCVTGGDLPPVRQRMTQRGRWQSWLARVS